MATCPQCGVKSREDPEAFVVEKVLAAKSLGTFSLSGTTMKWSAIERLQLRCLRCGWSVLGHLEREEYFIPDSAPPETTK